MIQSKFNEGEGFKNANIEKINKKSGFVSILTQKYLKYSDYFRNT